MKRIIGFMAVCTLAAAAGNSTAFASGKVGVSNSRNEALMAGWSAKKDLLNKPVDDDLGDHVGRVEDVVMDSKRKHVSVIVSTGGTAGAKKRDVAIPLSKLQLHDGKFILTGATKAAIEALPEFVYPAVPEHKEKKPEKKSGSM